MFRTQKKITLASQSPRRKGYFDALGIECMVHAAHIDERRDVEEPPEVYVARMARQKGEAVLKAYPADWVVAADTTVVLGQDILDKPRDKEEAYRTLLRLNGTSHLVRTALYVASLAEGIRVERMVTTVVTFGRYDSAVLMAYASTGEGLDKAGAYGIQGRGAFLVERIEGSYSNVVGLPLADLLSILLAHDVVATP